MEGLEILEGRLDARVRNPEGAQSCRCAEDHRLPPGIALEIARCRGHRGPLEVIKNDQSTRPYQLVQERQVDEDAVEDVAPVDERRVGHEAFGGQPRQGDLGPFGQQGADFLQTGGGDGLPSGMVEVVLEGIDGHVLAPVGSGPLEHEGLPDGQGRAAIGETDLDDQARLLFDQQVAQDVTVRRGQRYQREVAFRPGKCGPGLGQLAPHGPNGVEQRRLS